MAKTLKTNNKNLVIFTSFFCCISSHGNPPKSLHLRKILISLFGQNFFSLYKGLFWGFLILEN